MGTLSIYPSYPLFKDSTGQPLENGNIYVGTAGLDAVSNPVALFWDSALTESASQPVRTIGGYPSNNGTKAMLYMSGTDYSLAVLDKNNVPIFSTLNLTDINYAASSVVSGDVATNTADIATNTAAIATNVTDIGTNTTKLAGIEAGADVTDATNVNAAGATMNTDTSLAGNGYFLDEDDMSSNSATKAPSQQSVKAYVDATSASNYGAYITDNETDTTKTTWQSNLIGTRIDVSDGAYSNSTFFFDLSIDVLSINQRRITVNGIVRKEAGSEPTVTIKSVTAHQSGANGAEIRAVTTTSMATSGTKAYVGAVRTTTSGATGDGVVIASNGLDIERVDSSNELCFRVNFTLTATATQTYTNIILAGPRSYTGTLISSSNGTTF